MGQSIIAFNSEFFTAGYINYLEQMFSDLTEGNEVIIPGERRARLRAQHMQHGVAVPQALLDQIAGLSTEEI